MNLPLEPQLTAHVQRHARRLHRLACGFGCARDADDILQTLYTRWWRRMRDEPGWSPPESNGELFVCVRRVAIDIAAREQRDRARDERSPVRPLDASPEDSLQAFDRLRWILSRLPVQLGDALKASLAAGRSDDAAVARELGLTHAAFTARLFKARRAAEELASFYELLPLERANLLAELRYGGKSRSEIARQHGLSVDELAARCRGAEDALEKNRKVAS